MASRYDRRPKTSDSANCDEPASPTASSCSANAPDFGSRSLGEDQADIESPADKVKVMCSYSGARNRKNQSQKNCCEHDRRILLYMTQCIATVSYEVMKSH